jgi:hypothetical protein
MRRCQNCTAATAAADLVDGVWSARQHLSPGLPYAIFGIATDDAA